MKLITIHKSLRNVCTKVTGLFLILLLTYVPVSSLFTPTTAHAIPVVEVGPNVIANSALAAKDAGVFGVASLDGLGWVATNILIEQMLQSTIDWVNSGFKGRPVFVEDINAFLLDTADQYALGFIWNNNLVDLCSPFKFNIQSALEIQYTQQNRGYHAECRLSDAIGNIQNLTDFHNGGFISGGGWDAWHAITLNPQMHADGAFFEAQGALQAGIANARGQKIDLLKINDGFLSIESCEGEGAERKCGVTTPGSTIKSYLDKSLGLSADRLTVADEFDELLGALIGQLAGSLLGGTGITGSGSRNQSSASNEYFTNLRNTPTPTAIDPNALQEGISAQENSALTKVYQQLLATSAQTLLNCEDKNPGGKHKEILAKKRGDVQNELTRIAAGEKSVTSGMIENFRDVELPALQKLIEAVPADVGCTI